jgi:hypothetical protein
MHIRAEVAGTALLLIVILAWWLAERLLANVNFPLAKLRLPLEGVLLKEESMGKMQHRKQKKL